MKNTQNSLPPKSPDKNLSFEDMLKQALENGLRVHISSKVEENEANPNKLGKEEDTRTIRLLETLATNDWQYSGNVRYKITCEKFRDRGPKATENWTGADGIFTVYTKNADGQEDCKSILFQAKNKGNNKKIDEQIEDMEKNAPNGSMIIDYTDKGYFAQNGNEYEKDKEGIKLDEYFNDVFLSCKRGIRGLSYNNDSETLSIYSEQIADYKVKEGRGNIIIEQI